MIDLNKCKKLIEQALEYANGTHTTDDIFRGIEKRQYQLWDAEKSCLITEILEYPQKKVCHVFLGAGDLEEMHQRISTVVVSVHARQCLSCCTTLCQHG